MSRTPPPHGTLSRYAAGGCRCDGCRSAARAHWHETQKTRAKLGRPITATAEEVEATRNRLRLLASLGWSQPTIAEIADLTNATVSRIASGVAKRPRITTLWALDATFRQLTSRSPGAERSERAGIGASWAPPRAHGEYRTYAAGCRCRPCRDACTAYHREKNARHRHAQHDRDAVA